VLALAKRLEGCAVLPHLSVLAEGARVSERTVRRDLYALADAGWPLPPKVERVQLTGTPSARSMGLPSAPWSKSDAGSQR
jgi:predicted DNA-binding transcriptional regulator YafY